MHRKISTGEVDNDPQTGKIKVIQYSIVSNNQQVKTVILEDAIVTDKEKLNNLFPHGRDEEIFYTFIRV